MDPNREFTMDGETFARRRDRRVSFAETTAVHVFDRDDSSGTPPKSDSNVTLSPYSDSGGDDSSRDTREDGDDDNDDEEEMAVPPVRFIRDMTDSSPGSASAASVASNDDDNFFGSVSTSFMNSGGQSESEVSEEINDVTHDITLDSTAFSLHFRNIGRDDRSANSASSLLTTPTANNITPFVRTSINEPPGANDTISRLKFCDGLSSASLGDFSLLANNSNKYNFGNPSGSLNDLLRRVDGTLKPISPVAFETVCPPVDVLMDQNEEDAKHLTWDISHPIDVSMDENGYSAKLPTREVCHPIDVSMDKNGDDAKLLTVEISHPIDVSMDQSSDGAKLVRGEIFCPIDVSREQSGGGPKSLIGEVSHPIYVSKDQIGDGSTLLTGEVSRAVDVSLDENSDEAKLLTGEISHPTDVSTDQTGDGAILVKQEVSHPIDISMDENGHGVKLLTGEISRPIDVSMAQSSDGATLVRGEASHSTDVSLGENGDVAKLLTGDISCPVDVSMEQNGDGASRAPGEVARLIDVSMDENGNDAKLLTEAISHPIDVSMDQNGDAASLIRAKVSRPIDASMDEGGDGAKFLTGEISHPGDVSMDHTGVGATVVTGEVFHPIDVSTGENGHGAKLLTGDISHPMDQSGDGTTHATGEVSFPVDVSVDQIGDSTKPISGKVSHRIDVSIDKNGGGAGETSTGQGGNGATLVTGEVSFPVDVSGDQIGDGTNPLADEVSHPIDLSIDKNGSGAKLITPEFPHPVDVSMEKNGGGAKLTTVVSHRVGVSMEKNVNCDKLQISATHAFGDEPANEKDEDHSEDMHEDARSNTIPSPKVTATSSPQHTISPHVQSSIALASSPCTVQHPESDLPMVTAKVALVNAQTSSLAKMVQLSETCQLPSIGSELFKHSKRISSIKESILRELPKENITLSCSNYNNENLMPSESSVKYGISNQEFDLEGRKRKLQQLLGSVEDRPAKHAKPLAHENSLKQQEHAEKSQNCSLDWSKLVEDMSDITNVLVSPSVQKLTLQELGFLSDMMEKLRMARKFDRLSAFLRNHDSTDQRHQRLAEARSLHDKLLYEKAKLELNRLKLNKLYSKAELVRQRAQECLLLKSRISDHCSSNSKEEHNFRSFITQEEQERLISKRQALKAIEQNTKKLGVSFRDSCKITEDLSCDDIITIVKEDLKMRNTHSIVQRDANLWKLHDIVKDGNYCEIVLDYSFLSQRFRLGTSNSGSILLKTLLNKTKITQAFRDMNAHSAIEFVFRAKFTDHNIDNLKHARQETLETSLLLGNVIEVLHEVKAAKGEQLNLISTNFNCELSNTKVLKLQLRFMNFERGKKVVISLDLSDLSLAMYPSEPSALHIEIDRTMTTLDEVLLKEITALIERLLPGRLMILRLCRAVSQFVDSSM